MSSSRLLAKNTLLLYGRMFVVMLVSLYTSRVVFVALGVEDFGVYNAVGGFVALFSIISGSLNDAVSRYVTFEMGKNAQGVRRVIVASLMMMAAMAVAVVAVGEVVGQWFVATQMNIPEASRSAAGWVLTFSLLTFAVGLLTVPFNALILAHERMQAFAYISLVEAMGRLGVAWGVAHVAAESRLSAYALFTTLLVVAVEGSYVVYCRRHFRPDCRLRGERPSTALIKEICAFAGWNFVGAGSSVLKDQGVNLLLNVFCGPVANAARGVTMQVSGAVQTLSFNFVVAINPQITKRYAAGEHTACLQLVGQGSRLAFFLLFLPSGFVMIAANDLLVLWLTEVPAHTVNFLFLVLISLLLDSLSLPLITLMNATGRIRTYQLLVGGTLLLNFPLSWWLLARGEAPESVFVVSIVTSILCLVLRLVMLRSKARLHVGAYARGVLLRAVGVVATTAAITVVLLLPFSAHLSAEASPLFRLFLPLAAYLLAALPSCWLLGATKTERAAIWAFAKQKLTKGKG